MQGLLGVQEQVGATEAEKYLMLVPDQEQPLEFKTLSSAKVPPICSNCSLEKCKDVYTRNMLAQLGEGLPQKITFMSDN